MPIVLIIYSCIFINRIDFSSTPKLSTIFNQVILMFILAREFLLFIMHQVFHIKYFYKYHKKHHSIVKPMAIVYHYGHTVEFIFLTFSPILLGNFQRTFRLNYEYLIRPYERQS